MIDDGDSVVEKLAGDSKRLEINRPFSFFYFFIL